MTAVLFAAEYHPPFAPGGGEWSNAAWAAALARRGHRVTVVTLNHGGVPAREEHDGVTVIRAPFPGRLAPGQAEVGAGWLRNPLFYLYFAVHIWRAAREQGSELIHAQGKAAVPGAWLAARLRGVPLVVTVRDLGLLCPHGWCTVFERRDVFDCSLAQYLRRCVPYYLRHVEPGAGWRRRMRVRASSVWSRLDNAWRRFALRRAQAVIGVSRGILAVYPPRLVDGGRGAVVHTLPPTGAPPPDEVRAIRARLGIGPGPLVLYAGKVSLGKGFLVFQRALAAVRAAVPGVRFAVAGKGMRPEPAADVHALGSLAHADLLALYGAADLVVVPSIWPEPLSRVLLEAMSLGRPVVATAVGGTPEAVEHGVTGLLVPREDPDALARAVVDVLGDPARRARMGQAAARRAREVFGEGRVMEALEAVYTRARERAR